MATFTVSSLKAVEGFMGALAAVPWLKPHDGFKVYCIAAAVIVILLLRRLLSCRVNLPRGPPGLPIIGHMHLLGPAPHESLANMAQKYGPLMSIRLGARPCIVCSSPETAKEFLKTQDANFGSRPYTSQGHHLLYANQDVGFQPSTPSWRNLKKIFAMELTSKVRLDATRHVREDETVRLMRTIHEKRSVDLKAQLTTLVSNIISRMVLNRRHAGVADGTSTQIEKDFPEMIQTHLRLAGLFVPGDYIPALKWLDLGGLEAKMQKHAKRMDAFVSDILSQHREQRRKFSVAKSEYNMVDALLDQLERKDAPFRLTEDNVKALILDVFIAATETTAATTEWAMAELLRNPTLMAKAHAELDNVVGRERVVREADLEKLPYLQAMVTETFRLHPAAPLLLPRESAQASRAFGYDFPAKTRVLVNVWAIGRDPRIWAEPLVYDPDRFLRKEHMHIDVGGQHFELLAFGSGRRVCPGVSLGVVIVQIALASLLHSFDWSLPDPMRPGDLDMTELFGVTLPRAKPLPCIAKPRLAPHLYGR